MDLLARQAYWGVVVDCLVKFHHRSQAVARSEALAFEGKLQTGAYPTDDVIFHEEPFDTACAIAGTAEDEVDPLFDASSSEYEKILKKRGW
jgi:hypothetical protein